MEKNAIEISEKKGQELDKYPMSTMAVVVYSGLILLITVAIGFALMYLKSDQVSQAAALDDSIQSVENQITKLEEEEDLLAQAERLTKAVQGYSKYQKSELDWYSFLNDITDYTLSEITYTGFSIDRQKLEFRLDGVAPSYRVVAEEINLLSRNDMYDSVSLDSAVLRPESESNSRVAFTINIKPAANAFKKQNLKDGLDLLEETNI